MNWLLPLRETQPRPTSTYRYRDPVKRRAQMREVMRRRRAKGKR